MIYQEERSWFLGEVVRDPVNPTRVYDLTPTRILYIESTKPAVVQEYSTNGMFTHLLQTFEGRNVDLDLPISFSARLKGAKNRLVSEDALNQRLNIWERWRNFSALSRATYLDN